jgi:hypothetical protein
VENFEALWSAEVHILMTKGGEFSRGGSVRIGHTHLHPLVEVGDPCVAVDSGNSGVLDVEFHISTDLSDLCGVLQAWRGYDKYL